LTCAARDYADLSQLLPDTDERATSRVFHKPFPLVSLGCTIHPEERAYLTISPSTIYDILNCETTYKLEIPYTPGQYVLRAVSPDYGIVEYPLSINKPGHVVLIDIQFQDD
jgi:hypothetical protein